MKTRKLRKFLMLLASALLLVSVTVGATVAYLTSTDEVVNTFTVGNVTITLDEAKVKYDATEHAYVKDTDERVKANAYKLSPDLEILKDPTVHVGETSDDCYVRVKVTFQYDPAADTVLQEQWINWNTNNWTVKNMEKGEVTENGKTWMTRTYTVNYNNVAKAKDNLVVFDKITLPETLTNADLEKMAGLKISVKAEAIQVAGFENNADGAWAAFPAN